MKLVSLTRLSYFCAVSAFCVHGDNEGVRYLSNSSIFDNLVDTSIPAKLVTNETLWAEGPICLPDGTLIFSEVWRNRAVSWTEKDGIQVVASPSDFDNGNSVDPQGRIVGTSGGRRGIMRRESNGSWVTLVDSYEGRLLNGPDDVAVSSDGNIWFSDPGFGLTDLNQGYGGKQELDGLYFFRYNPRTKDIVRLNTPEIRQPNGLAFSPDEKILYVTDTNTTKEPGYIPSKIYAYEVSNGNLKNGKLFKNVSPGVPDGIKVDEYGNLWSSSEEGVHIYNSKGDLLGKILIESLTSTSNLAFGKDISGRKWLYVTATTRVLRIAVKTESATARWLGSGNGSLPLSASAASVSAPSATSEANKTLIGTSVTTTPSLGSEAAPIANSANTVMILSPTVLSLFVLFL